MFDETTILIYHSVRALGEKAFAAETSREASRRAGKHISVADTFLCLEKLEDGGYITGVDLRTPMGKRRWFSPTGKSLPVAEEAAAETLPAGLKPATMASTK